MIQRDGSSLLCVEFYGDSLDALVARMEAVERDLTGASPACRIRHVLDLAKQAKIWSFREAALGLSTAMKSDGKAISFVEDTAVAPEKLRDYIERFIAIVRRHGTTAGVYAHASVGCLHVRPVVNLKTAAGVATFEAIANEVADLVLEFGGALSGEHGDGLVRGAFNEKMFGSELYQAFRAVKRTFDPNGLFNPGRIVDTPPITSHLRFGAGYQTPAPATMFDFSEHKGFGRAVEMCSGVGLCRKTREGTMCPSFMVTREEAHSTRGRANTLRLAMNGELGDAKLSDQGVHDVLDLCLECRACKSECPVGVDVARFKSEFLSGYWERHGLTMRAHAFGHAHAASRPRQPLRAAVERHREQQARAVGDGADHRRRSAANVAAVDEVDTPQAAVIRPQSADTTRMVTSWGAALRRYLHRIRGAGDWRRRHRRAECLGPPHGARAERVLRPAADFTGTAQRGAAAGGGQCPCALRGGRCRPVDRVHGAELPVGGSRGCAGSAARRAATAGPRGGTAVGALRGVPRTRMRRRPRHIEAQGRPRQHTLAPALSPAIDGPGGARPGRCCRACPGRRSRISRPAAAAWPARSATRAITTTCRARSASVSCCRRRARSMRDRCWSPPGLRAATRCTISRERPRCTRRCCCDRC